MLTRSLLIVIVMMSSWATAPGVRGMQAPDDALAAVAAMCGRHADGSAPVGEENQPTFPLGLPAGVAGTPLASGAAHAMPPGLDAQLGFGRLVVATESLPRVAAGPLLIVVETGAAELVRNGESTYHEPDSDSFTLIERQTIYTFINASAEPLSILVVAVEPPGGLIAAYGGQSVWESLEQEQEAIERDRIANADLERLSQEETLLFFGCARWDDPSAKLASNHGYAGPVGFLVLEGLLAVTSAAEESFGPGECTVVPRYTPFSVTAGDQPAVGIVMGAVPASGLGAAATPEIVDVGTTMTGQTTACAG